MNKESERGQNKGGIKSAIDDLLDKYDLRQKYNEAKVLGAWEKLMGKPIAERTEKLFIADNTLIVKLNSAPLKQELIMSSEKILKLIEEEFGDGIVKRIKFL